MFDFSAFFAQYGNLFLQGTADTLIMTCVATILAYVIGIPLGILLVVTSPNGCALTESSRPSSDGSSTSAARFLSSFCSSRSSRSHALSWELRSACREPSCPSWMTAAPFAARMVEQSLEETDSGLVEAAQSFGASTWQIVWKVYLKETLPSLVRGAAITFVTLFGYSAMAGTVGAGGLGDIAIRYGYQRFQTDVMIFAVLLCVVLVIVFQAIGDVTARKIDKRRR